MHELSMLAALMRKLDSVSREHRNARIAAVQVRLGALSHISAAHFREHFQESARGTCAEGAKLEIETAADLTDPRAQDILLESVEVEA